MAKYTDISCGIHMFSDLQLAAELGKSLLERNEYLEKQLEEYTEVNYQQEQELKVLKILNINKDIMTILSDGKKLFDVSELLKASTIIKRI